METRPSHVAVGAFVMLLLLGGFGFLIWAEKSAGHIRMASHYARFLESVQGVDVGSNVLFGGIPIGRVTAVTVDPTDSGLARIDMAVEASAPIRSNSVATLEMQGFTGGVLVDISRGTERGSLLTDGAEIPARYTPIGRVIADMPALIAKANAMLDNAAKIFSAANIAAAGRIMANVQKFRQLVAINSEEIGRTLDSVAVAGKQISKTNAAFRDLGADMQAFTGKLALQIDSASSDVRALASTVGTLAHDYNNIYDENRQPIEDFSASGFYELPATIAEVDLAMGRIKRIAHEIAENPAQYFLQDRQAGFQPPPAPRAAR